MKCTAFYFALMCLPQELEALQEWIPSKDYIVTPKLAMAVDRARQFYYKQVSHKKAAEQIVYNARSTDQGYIVELLPVYVLPEGERFVSVDGENCVYLTKEYKVMDYRQCVAVWPDSLEK
ncbi:hypothetical protein ACG1BZ_11485 [Microbulbifer sp. CNSA002]|uniref:hypothetical protein n=1 Tax=Microbulbifer sp. CNSA002 TaxID=3373604 RepID=UPI0039B6992E